MTTAKDMTKAELERAYETAEAHVQELQKRRAQLEEELRPYRDRVHQEKLRADNEKRDAEHDAQTIANLHRFEKIVTENIRDPLLRKPAFEYLLQRSMSFSPFAFMR